jgi:hypothetical protein
MSCRDSPIEERMRFNATGKKDHDAGWAWVVVVASFVVHFTGESRVSRPAFEKLPPSLSSGSFSSEPPQPLTPEIKHGVPLFGSMALTCIAFQELVLQGLRFA